MRLGLVCLVLAYVLSQFYRVFLAVLAPMLQADLGAGPEDLALASGVWFLTFALMQIPVGAALDRIGPRATSTVLFALGGGGGALAFALATSPAQVTLAMGLLGIGCSPVLMAAYVILARGYPAAVFATLGAAVIGVGTLGNIAGSTPLALAAQTFGWRQSMAGVALLSVLVAVALWWTVADPPRAVRQSGSVLDVLRLRSLWPVFAMMFVCYAPAAGLRGLWAGPYALEVYGADAVGIGRMTLIMGLAVLAGNFAYGPLDRWLGTRKWVVLSGNLAVVLGCAALAAWPGMGLGAATVAFAAIGFFGASYGMVIAHGRAFVPPHLTGRGVTMLNLFGIAGAGIAQVATGQLHVAMGPDPLAAHRAIFVYFAVVTLLGLAAYAFARDRID